MNYKEIQVIVKYNILFNFKSSATNKIQTICAKTLKKESKLKVLIGKNAQKTICCGGLTDTATECASVSCKDTVADS